MHDWCAIISHTMELRFVDRRSSPEAMTGSCFKTVDRGEQQDDAWRHQVQSGRNVVDGTVQNPSLKEPRTPTGL